MERLSEMSDVMRLKKTELKEYTKEELEAELRHRAYGEALAAYDLKKKATELVVKGIDILLAMVPKHDERAGCDDVGHWNGMKAERPRDNDYTEDCVRCTLLCIKETGTSEFTLDNTISLTWIGDPPVPPSK
jgi:hypothetical protein